MIIKNVSNQDGANNVAAAPWHTKSQSTMLLVAAFLENYLPVSTWTFDGSSIEWHEKKHWPFSLFDVRFGSRVIQISGRKSTWRSKMTFPPLPPV